MSNYTGDLAALAGTLTLAYGEHVVSGHIVQQVTEGEGDAARTTVVVWLGEGVWEGIKTAYWGGGEIPAVDYHFHHGYLANSMAEATFTGGEWTQGVDPWNYGGQTYSGTAYVIIKLPAGVTGEDDLSQLKFVCKCLRIGNYNANGEQLDKDGNVVGTASEAPKEQFFFYSTNPARCTADLLLVRRGLAKSRINWPAWVAWRNECDVTLDWQGGELAGRPTYNESTLANVVLGVNGNASKPYGIPPNAWNGKIITNERIPVGVKGYYEVEPGIGTMLMGLSTNTDPASPNDVDFFLRFQVGGTVYIQSGGDILATIASGWTEGDRFKIEKDPVLSTFLMYKNGLPFRPDITHAFGGSSEYYGVSYFYEQYSEQYTASFQPIGSAARTRKQFECGLAFPNQTDFAAALEAVLLVSCATVQNPDGKMVFKSPSTLSSPRPVEFAFNMGNISESTFKMWRMAREQRPTKMSGHFRNQDVVTLRKDPVEVTRDALVDALGRENVVEGLYLGTMSKGQAQCVMNYHMRLQSDLDVYCSFTADGRSWKVMPGDVVTVTHDVPGWVNVKFLVIDATDESSIGTADTRTFTCQIYTDDLYDPDGDQTPLVINVPSFTPSILAAPPPVKNITLNVIAGFNINREFSVRGEGHFDFDYTNFPYPQRAALYITRPGEVEKFDQILYPSPTGNDAYVQFTAQKAGLYLIRVVSQNQYGVFNEAIVHPSVAINIENVTYIIPPPTNFGAVFGLNTIQYDWLAPTTNPEYIREYEIWKSDNVSTFPDTTSLTNRVWRGISLSATEQINAAVSTNVVRWLRAVDYMGNASAWVLISNAGGQVAVAPMPVFTAYDFTFDITPSGGARLLHSFTVSENADNIRLFQILDASNNMVSEGRNNLIMENVVTGSRAFTRSVRAILNTGHIGAEYPVDKLSKTFAIPDAPTLSLAQAYASSIVIQVTQPANFNTNLHSGMFLRVEVSDTPTFVVIRESFSAFVTDEKVTVQGQRSRFQTVYVRARYEDAFGAGSNSINLSHTFDYIANGDLGTGIVDFGQIATDAIRAVHIQALAIQSEHIAANAIDLSKFATGLRPMVTVDTLPALPDPLYPNNTVVILSTDSKLYRNQSGVWTSAVPAVDITGTLTGAQIGPSTIDYSKFAPGLRPIETVDALPSLPTANYPPQAVVMLSTDGKMYRNVANVWVTGIPTVDLQGNIVGTQLASGILDYSKFAPGLRPVETVDALPSLPNSGYPPTSLVVLSTDGKLYRNVANVWTSAVPASDLTGTIGAGLIGFTIGGGNLLANSSFENPALAEWVSTTVTTLQLVATVRDQNGSAITSPPPVVTWSSSNTSVATVDSNGVVTGISPGTAQITATSSGIDSPVAIITVT